MGKKVIIETEDCVGCESCVELCADVFGVDEGAQKAVVILAFGVLIFGGYLINKAKPPIKDIIESCP
jgi:ferredoxin